MLMIVDANQLMCNSPRSGSQKTGRRGGEGDLALPTTTRGHLAMSEDIVACHISGVLLSSSR